MIGNDVIDLGDPETAAGACHARFDARVFAPAELAALAASAAPRRLRWTLWAAKEAAYKVARKLDRTIAFAPRRFVVQLLGDGEARVVHGRRRLAVALRTELDCVHAVAHARDLRAHARLRAAQVVTRVERLAAGSLACPGAAVRALAIATVAPLLGRDPQDLVVARDGRIPRLHDASGALPYDLSLSHHGRFVAFACVLPRAHVVAEASS